MATHLSAMASELPRFELSYVRSAAELALAASLRRRIFQERRSVTFDETLEAQRDREGHVFLLFDGGNAVAVGRVLPYPSRLSPLVDLSHRAAEHGADSEIGRIACLSSSEQPLRALLLLTLGSCWLLEHTRWRRYVGYCHPKLLDSYRRIGAAAGAAIHVPGRADEHHLISGSYEAAATLGTRLLGLSAPHAGRL